MHALGLLTMAPMCFMRRSFAHGASGTRSVSAWISTKPASARYFSSVLETSAGRPMRSVALLSSSCHSCRPAAWPRVPSSLYSFAAPDQLGIASRIGAGHAPPPSESSMYPSTCMLLNAAAASAG